MPASWSACLAQLLTRLHSAPTAPVAILAATLAIPVRAQVAAANPAWDHHRARSRDRHLCRYLSSPRAQQLAPLPGVGTINLAQLLAEVGPIPDRVDNILARENHARAQRRQRARVGRRSLAQTSPWTQGGQAFLRNWRLATSRR